MQLVMAKNSFKGGQKKFMEGLEILSGRKNNILWIAHGIHYVFYKRHNPN